MSTAANAARDVVKSAFAPDNKVGTSYSKYVSAPGTELSTGGAFGQGAYVPGQGIDDPGLPGAKQGGGPITAPESKKTAETVVTGGSKSTNITITFKDLIGELNINSSGGFKESTEKMKEMVLDQLTRVLSLAQANS